MVPYDPNNAANFNPNTPIITGPGVSADEIKGVIDQSNKLNESLKTITQTLKDIAESRAFGNLEAKLESYGKKLVEYAKVQQKQADLDKEITAQEDKLKQLRGGAGQQFVDNLKDQVENRRKLGEETNKLSSLESQLFQAQTGSNQALIDQLQDQIDRQAEKVDKLRLEQQSYKELITDHSKLVALLGEEGAKIARQLILNQNLKEVYGDYITNHKAEIDLINQTLTGEERKLAIQKYVVKTLQEENYLVKNTLKLRKEISNALGLDQITLAAIIKQAFTLDKIYNEHAKQLGISRGEVKGMATAYANSSASAGSLASFGSSFARTNKNIVEASSELNKSLGTAAFLSKERLHDQVTLTKLMGLDVESATKVQHLSIVSGKSNKQVLDSVNNQVLALGKQKGIYLDNRQILSDVAKVSGQLAAQYKNNPELLAKAVVQAKELGLTLQQTAAMGDKLLDFPSSIESELKAELLTGKALNLEQARYYALMGDSAQAAKELMDNVGGIAEFQNLNVLQQRAMAEAVGMTKDELADSLKQQDLLKKTGDASIEALNERRRLAIETGKTEEFYQELRRAGTSEEMIANQVQLAQQDKMNLLVDKLLEGLSSLATPILNIVDWFGKIVEYLGGAKVLVGVVGGLIVGKIAFGLARSVTQMMAMNALLATQNTQISIQSALAKSLLTVKEQEALAEVTSASARSFGAAIPLIIGGVAAVASAVGLGMVGGFSGGGESFSETSKANMGGTTENKNITIVSKVDTNVNLGGTQLAKVTTQQTRDANTKYDNR